MHSEPHFLKRAFWVPAISRNSPKPNHHPEQHHTFPSSPHLRHGVPRPPPPTPLAPPQPRVTSPTPSPLPDNPTHRSIPPSSCSTPTTTRRMVVSLPSHLAPPCVPRRLLAPPRGRRRRSPPSQRSPCPRGGSSEIASRCPSPPLVGGCAEPRG